MAIIYWFLIIQIFTYENVKNIFSTGNTVLVNSPVLYRKYYWDKSSKQSNRDKQYRKPLRSWWQTDRKSDGVENNPIISINFSCLLMLGIEDTNMQKGKIFFKLKG